MSILIVDDFLDSRLIMESTLRHMGYTLETSYAESARGAFTRLGMGDSKIGVSDIDLILMDVDMPEMDGVEACRLIKAVPELRDIPIIMVTSHDEMKYLEEAFAAGAMDYVTKPVNRTELGVRVRSALNLKCETDCRKLILAKLEQESMAKSQILATVTHELRTPLTSIMGYVDMMLMHQDQVGPLNQRQEKYLEHVREDSRILNALIADLLDIAQIEAGNLKLTLAEVEVPPQIEHIARSIQGQFVQKRISLALDVPDDLPPIMADQVRFSQVVANLVSNAYKYSTDGGTVTISARERNGLVQIDVSDTGVGISKTDQARLFHKFFRADTPATSGVSGTGLGLYITKMLVEGQDGKIRVESELGAGSVFSFFLPVVSRGPTRGDQSHYRPLETITDVVN